MSSASSSPLGAGLDTFAQRRVDLTGRIDVFEIDQPGTQEWKRRRLLDLGYRIPEWLRFVPVDFEANADWYAKLVQGGFDASAPAVMASTGVSMYLTKEATRQVLERAAGFRSIRHLPGTALGERYFTGRTDGLKPSSGEDLLVATT